MSGEVRIVRGALGWGAAAALPGAAIAYVARGSHGAASVLAALALVLGNAALAALFSALAARITPTVAGMVALPSFAVRMVAIFTALAALKHASFIDVPTFAVTFGLAVTAVLLLEARAWKRTPWLALTLQESRPTLQEKA